MTLEESQNISLNLRMCLKIHKKMSLHFTKKKNEYLVMKRN